MMFNMNHAVFHCNCTQIILVFQSFFSSKSVMLVFCHQYLLKEAPKQRPLWGIFPFHHASSIHSSTQQHDDHHDSSPCRLAARNTAGQVSQPSPGGFTSPGEWPWNGHQEVDHRSGSNQYSILTSNAGRGVMVKPELFIGTCHLPRQPLTVSEIERYVTVAS